MVSVTCVRAALLAISLTSNVLGCDAGGFCLSDPRDTSTLLQVPAPSFVPNTMAWALNPRVERTLQKMTYWKPAGAPLPISGRYLLCAQDHAGPNNIRIGIEMDGVVAKHTGRTLVLPPARPACHLDHGPMMDRYYPQAQRPAHGVTFVEDLIILQQLRGYIPTLTAAEFEVRENISWHAAIQIAQQPRNATKCSLPAYADMEAKYVYMNSDYHRDRTLAFNERDERGCASIWDYRGLRLGFKCNSFSADLSPNSVMRSGMGDAEWAVLRHAFVWHKDMFDVAASVVNYLGLFSYVAMHARYTDLSCKDCQVSPASLFHKWKPWLADGSTVYVATDDAEKFRQLEFPDLSGVRLVMWDDLFGNDTGRLLVPTKAKFSAERWFKMMGPVEELICTYSKLFVGTESSTFSLHIDSMRIHAGAPVPVQLTHTGDVPADQINGLIRLWKRRKHRKPLPSHSLLPVDRP